MKRAPFRMATPGPLFPFFNYTLISSQSHQFPGTTTGLWRERSLGFWKAAAPPSRIRIPIISFPGCHFADEVELTWLNAALVQSEMVRSCIGRISARGRPMPREEGVGRNWEGGIPPSPLPLSPPGEGSTSTPLSPKGRGLGVRGEPARRLSPGSSRDHGTTQRSTSASRAGRRRAKWSRPGRTFRAGRGGTRPPAGQERASWPLRPGSAPRSMPQPASCPAPGGPGAAASRPPGDVAQVFVPMLQVIRQGLRGFTEVVEVPGERFAA